MYSDHEGHSMRHEANPPDYPSAAEREKMKGDHLADEGCKECGEDDPSKLDFYQAVLPDCKAVQMPPDPRVVLCDECHANRDTYREKMLQKARHRTDNDGLPGVAAVAFYECGAAEHAEKPDEPVPPGGPCEVTIPIRCRCGADFMDVVYLDGGD